MKDTIGIDISKATLDAHRLSTNEAAQFANSLAALRAGRQARDLMLGLMKTCRKLGISFFAYLGDRLGVKGLTGCIPFLPELVAVRPA